MLRSLAQGRVGTGGWVPAATTQPVPPVWGHCSSGGFCGYPEKVITMENGTGAESKLLLELGRFWGPKRVTGTERSPVPCVLCPVLYALSSAPCALCAVLCALCAFCALSPALLYIGLCPLRISAELLQFPAPDLLWNESKQSSWTHQMV